MKNLIVISSVVLVTGFFFLGKIETKKKSLSIYDLAYEAKKSDPGYNPMENAKDKTEMSKLVKRWKRFNKRLHFMTSEQILSSLEILDAEHKTLLKRSYQLDYPLDLLEMTNPRLRFVVANRINKKVSRLNVHDFIKLERNRPVWREITREANNLHFVAALNKQNNSSTN